ncbi:MAG: pyruvate formate-lyase-activating protein [Mycoplasma sp.]
MNNSIKAKQFKIETFGAVDGPGLRLVIFFQGCPLRCLYCHNPESWNFDSDQSSEISVDDIITLYKKNESYYKKGGITVSGGEPTLHIDFLVELSKACIANKIHLAIDTSGFFFNENNEKFLELIKNADLWLIDIKHINHEKYKVITGNENQSEINLIKFLEKAGKHYWVRQVLLPGFTDDEADLFELGKFISHLKYMDKFEILPYHNMAKFKYENLGMEYRLKDLEPPTMDHIKKCMSYIQSGVNSQKENKIIDISKKQHSK